MFIRRLRHFILLMELSNKIKAFWGIFRYVNEGAEFLFSAFDNSNINYLSRIHDVFMITDENYRSSQRSDQWYSIFDLFPDDVFINGCANQNRVHFVVFTRLSVWRGWNSLVRDYGEWVRKHYNPPPCPSCEWTVTLRSFPRFFFFWLSAILSFQTSCNKYILFNKCIEIKYETIKMYGVFFYVISARFSLLKYYDSYRSSLLCLVFSEVNNYSEHAQLDVNRRNAVSIRMVYCLLQSLQHQLWINYVIWTHWVC